MAIKAYGITQRLKIQLALTAKFIFYSAALLVLPPLVFAEKSPGFTPNAELQISHDSNIRRLTNDFEDSDTIISLKPTLEWLLLFGKHQFDLAYKGEYGRYSDKSELDFEDHSLKAHALFDHNLRFNTEFELGIIRDHDDPGSTNAVLINQDDFNEYERDYIQGKLYYGTSQSIGQIVLNANHSERSYTNNNQSFRDYDSDQFTTSFFYRIAPQTRILLEAGFTEYDYQYSYNGGIDQSSDDQRLLLGIEWDTTAKTTGTFKIGHMEKAYDHPIFSDISGLSLSLDMNWKPNTYTEVKLGITRDTTESAQAFTGGFISEYLRAELKHMLTSRTALTALVGLGDEEYFYAIDRSDEREDFRIGLKHELRRWLSIGLELRYESRDSNLNINDYSANLFMLTLSTSFD